MCDDFSSTRVIGEGSFGKVYKGSSQELGDVAIKVLDDESSQGWDEWVVSEQGAALRAVTRLPLLGGMREIGR